MTVKELITFLETQDPTLPVAFQLHSEAKLMELDDIEVNELQPARNDGWIHSIWGVEPKLPTIKYLLFPGN